MSRIYQNSRSGDRSDFTQLNDQRLMTNDKQSIAIQLLSYKEKQKEKIRRGTALKMTQKRICILGGGFGGLYTALRLSQLPTNPPEKAEIVLVDRKDRFIFLPLLYELLASELETWEIAPPFTELLANTSVRFHQGAVGAIDVESQQVQLEDGKNLPYDRLVLALGGETPLDLVPGCQEYAFPFGDLTDAYRLQEKLRALETSDADKIRIAIVGAGYNGVELACKLADRLKDRGRVRLIEQTDTILRSCAEYNRETAKAALEERGIWIDLETTVNAIEEKEISLVYQGQTDTIPVDIVLWTVGNQVPSVVRKLPLKQNDRARVAVTPTLQAIEHPEIFVLGDLATCQDAASQQVPASAQAAIQQADYAAWNVWASMSDRPLLPFRYQSLGEMMTLGLENATLSGLGVKLDGQLAHIIRRLVYLYRMPTVDHQLKVGLSWISRPLREMLAN